METRTPSAPAVRTPRESAASPRTLAPRLGSEQDAKRYAAREERSAEAKNYRAGDTVIIVGASTVVIILAVVIILLLI